MLVIATLSGMAAVAGEAGLETRMRKRDITLSADAPERTHVVMVASDTATVVLFDSPLLPSSVEVGASRERFERLEVTERALVILPREALTHRERVLLTVRFADGLMPQRLTLALVSDPAAVDLQLRVFRNALAPEALQERVLAMARRCEEAEGFGPFLFSRDLKGDIEQKRFFIESVEAGAVTAITPSGKRVFVGPEFAALELELEPTSGGAPWRLGRAELEHRGARLPMRTVHASMPVFLAGQKGKLLLELPTTEGVFNQALLVLHLFERDGTRHLTVRARLELAP
ncbi:DUF2381 family protein [Myxococcus stipitatus]|uniref:DUF2381 family protein n=1 Tax=Myxococcus stipitatus TaxID=83455 RepID=UPI002279B1FE|nr:DUF2381 family protein [Myxococcus stipitatus]